MLRARTEWTTPGLGTGIYTTLIVVAGFFVLMSTMANILSFGAPRHNLTHLIANQFGFMMMAALYLIWVFRVGRQLTSAPTGAGFGVAALALTLRAVCEWVMSFTCLIPVTLSWVELEATSPWVCVARDGGLISFLWGLGLVLAATMAERP